MLLGYKRTCQILKQLWDSRIGSGSLCQLASAHIKQAHKRATILGTRSFGKGSVQTIIPLGAGNGRAAADQGALLHAVGANIDCLKDSESGLESAASFTHAKTPL